MNRSGWFFLAVFALFFSSCDNSQNTQNTAQEQKDSAQRIVSLHGAVTEIVAALGHDNQIVGRDVTSVYPESVANSAKDLGHVRTLTIEPIVALDPTIILASDKDINPDLQSKIKESGIPFHLFHQEYSVEGTKALIKDVANQIHNTNYEPLLQKIDADIAKLTPIAAKPKVLFIYARGAGTLLVAGKGTPMANMIEIAGGENAASNVDDFKPLTPEAVIQANPDFILMFDAGFESIGGENGLLKMPGVAQTRAGKNKAFLLMDAGKLANFGPRVGEGALELNKLMVEGAK